MPSDNLVVFVWKLFNSKLPIKFPGLQKLKLRFDSLTDSKIEDIVKRYLDEFHPYDDEFNVKNHEVRECFLTELLYGQKNKNYPNDYLLLFDVIRQIYDKKRDLEFDQLMWF